METREEARWIEPQEEVNLSEYVRVVLKHWRMVVALAVAGCLIAVVVCLLLAEQYEATASILPPPDDSGGALQSLAGQMGQAGAGAAGSLIGGLLGGGSTKDIFVGILKSRTVQDDVIKKFDLVKAYGYDPASAWFPWFAPRAPMRDTRKKLEKMMSIDVSDESIISVTTWAYDRKTAADMANFYIDNLDRLNTSINITDSGRQRLFLQGRVVEAQKALKMAEEQLKEYQSNSKAVGLEGQIKAVIEGAAILEGQILAAEVQLTALQTYATQRNPDVIRLKESIEEMRRQLKRMEYGREGGVKGHPGGGTAADFIVPLGSLPATGLELIRLIREEKIQETIYTLLTQQLEQTKIAEAKDTPTVKVLDRAVVSEVSSYPKIHVFAAIGGAASMFLGICVAFFLEHVEGIRRRRKAEILTDAA